MEETADVPVDLETTAACGSSCSLFSAADAISDAALTEAADAATTAACGSSCSLSSAADADVDANQYLRGTCHRFLFFHNPDNRFIIYKDNAVNWRTYGTDAPKTTYTFR